MRKVLEAINRGSEFFLIGALSFTAIVAISQVIGRYVFHHSIFWSGEICRYLLVWITFTGTSLLIRRKRMICLSFLAQKFPPEFRRILSILINTLVSIFFLIVICGGSKLVILNISQVSLVTGISMAYVYASIPITFSLMLINSIVSIIEDIKNRP